MGIGVVALQTSQKNEIVPPPGPPGPPFLSTSADNGLSVDATSGRIVLGNDTGDPGQPAALLSNREIVTEDALFNVFSVVFNAILSTITTALDGSSIQMLGAPGAAPFIFMGSSAGGSPQINLVTDTGGDPQINLSTTGAGSNAQVSAASTLSGNASFFAQTTGNGTAFLRIRSAPDSLEILTTGTGTITFQINNVQPVWRINTATGNTQIGPTLTTDNTAALQVTGSLTNRRFIQSQGAGAYGVDRDLDSSKNFINSAAATFNLPNMAGASDRPGFIFRLCIKNVAGATVQLFAGQTALFGSLSTSAGGTLASADVGAYLVMVWDSANWTTETFLGAWILT